LHDHKFGHNDRVQLMALGRKTIVAFALVVGVVLVNVIRLELPAIQTLKGDSRNAPVTFVSYYSYGVRPDIIVFDLWKVDGTASRMDVMRVLLQFADKLKDRSFSEVRLAWRGNTRFVIPGAYFKQVGEEYGWQNPMYIVRTFPEHIHTPEGDQAFSTWTGGVLGVLGQQMDDVRQFNDVWYGNEINF